MNLTHLKYAVEIAQCGSINKASEKLYVGQPNLSRAVKELEGTVGIQIFERSAKGMGLTPDGEIFIRYAKSILKQIESVENMFSKNATSRQRFSVSCPCASYIAEAFARFSFSVSEKENVEAFYKETNSMRTIKNILQDDYSLGIIRYAENYEKYYKALMLEKGLRAESITQFSYVLAMSDKSPLAQKENVSFDDLRDYTEIAHADSFVPFLPLAEMRKEELPDNISRRIFIFERASQFELLSRNLKTFMWISPVPQSLLDRYSLVQRRIPENNRLYNDILIHREDHALTELDKLFIKELYSVKNELF